MTGVTAAPDFEASDAIVFGASDADSKTATCSGAGADTVIGSDSADGAVSDGALTGATDNVAETVHALLADAGASAKSYGSSWPKVGSKDTVDAAGATETALEAFSHSAEETADEQADDDNSARSGSSA